MKSLRNTTPHEPGNTGIVHGPINSWDEDDGNSEVIKFWKWEDIGQEWISSCLRVFIVFVAVVACQTSVLSESRWWMSIVTMKVWMVVFVLGQVVANVYLRKVQADCVLKVEEHTSRINADATTTVVGEGPEIDLESANVESVLHRFRRNEEEEALGPLLDV